MQPRVVWKFEYQKAPWVLTICVESNLASCRRTRKSTSGGAAVWGKHVIKTWANTKNVVAKSSAEAELYGTVRGSCEGLGLQTLYSGFGMAVAVRVFLDAHAVRG